MASTSEYEQQQFWELKITKTNCLALINNIPAKPEELTQFILITNGK